MSNPGFFRGPPFPARRRSRPGGYGRSTWAPARDSALDIQVSEASTQTTVGETFIVWGYAVLTAPSAGLSATSTTNGLNGGTLSPATPTLTAYGGANASLTAPTPAITITATVPGVASAALIAPRATVVAGATAAALANATLTFGNLLSTYAVVGYSGAVCSVTVGGATVVAAGTVGASGGANITLPLFQLVAAGTVRGLSSADLIMPAAQLGGVGVAWVMAPSAVLVAIGTATVTAAYEAYSVNLNHKPIPGVIPVDEVTHYTNFPFDRIVRYKNSYFGVAADGLYLLQGTTDHAATPTDIPWSWRTGMSDFGSAQQKTIESVYFGGRLGAASISLYVGEAGAQSYSYPTPAVSIAQNYRQVFGRGIKARYYALGAAGTGVMEIDDVDFNIDKMTRRI